MPSDATLSVITISYHDPAGLARTLDSVAAQTYAPLEHIVIDGGSGPIVERCSATHSCRTGSLERMVDATTP